MEEKSPAGKVARRRLLAAGGILSLFAMLKIWGVGRRAPVIDCGPAVEKKPVKLLSQDGQLMEVDPSRMRLLKKKISNEDMQQWIHKHPSNDNHTTSEL